LTECGAIIAPPVPAFYLRPRNIHEMVDHTARRMLDLFELSEAGTAWTGLEYLPGFSRGLFRYQAITISISMSARRTAIRRAHSPPHAIVRDGQAAPRSSAADPQAFQSCACAFRIQDMSSPDRVGGRSRA
jgi:hypothetical protein